MITLNEYIKESLLDDEDEVMDRYDAREAIKKFIDDNYGYAGKLSISDKPNKNGKYEVSCSGNVEVENRNLTYLTNDLFEWGTVGEFFSCFKCTSLTSLKGAPKKVGRDFDCSFCDSLITLDGVPKEVEDNFNCSRCFSLKSLKGAPQKVGRTFYCSFCKLLTSLEGAPKYVKNFYCTDCESLKSLKGAPKEVKNFYCKGCTSLKSLKGAPKCENIISDL